MTDVEKHRTGVTILTLLTLFSGIAFWILSAPGTATIVVPQVGGAVLWHTAQHMPFIH